MRRAHTLRLSRLRSFRCLLSCPHAGVVPSATIKDIEARRSEWDGRQLGCLGGRPAGPHGPRRSAPRTGCTALSTAPAALVPNALLPGGRGNGRGRRPGAGGASGPRRPHQGKPGRLGRGAEGQRAAAIAKGGCWEDRVALSPELGADFRWLCGIVDPWELGDGPAAGIDGISLRLRCEAPARSRTIHMWSPDRKRAPAQHRWVTLLLELAVAAFRDSPSAWYLSAVRPYFEP
jgi:hypothetical protein